MKKLLKIVLKALLSVVILVVVGITGLVVYVKYFYDKDVEVVFHYADSLPVKKESFVQEFEELHQITLDNYSLYKSKHIDMDSLKTKFLSRIKTEAHTSADFACLLKEYFAALNAGHASLYINSYTANYIPSYIEGRVFVSSPTDYLLSNGFADKDEVIAVNHIPTPQWLTEHEKSIAASTGHDRRLKAARSIFTSLCDTVALYTVARGNDTLDITLRLKKHDFFPETGQTSLAEWKVLHDSIGYINILSMTDPVMDDFDKAFQHVKALPYLIVDVRSNGGGSSGNGRDICKYLIKKPQPHCLNGLEMKPCNDAFKGKVYVLASNYTFSAAESFVHDMKESGDAVIVGEETGGDTGNRPRVFHTRHGIYFRLPTANPAVTPKGAPLEGKGVKPDHEVHQTVPDFMQDKDTMLDFILQIIYADTPSRP